MIVDQMLSMNNFEQGTGSLVVAGPQGGEPHSLILSYFCSTGPNGIVVMNNSWVQLFCILDMHSVKEGKPSFFIQPYNLQGFTLCCFDVIKSGNMSRARLPSFSIAYRLSSSERR